MYIAYVHVYLHMDDVRPNDIWTMYIVYVHMQLPQPLSGKALI